MTRSKGELSRFAAIFASGTMLSRVLGLVRDMVIGPVIGDVSRDAFLLAFRFPNMLRDLIGEGAMNAAFVPVFADVHDKRSQKAFRELVASALSAMLLILGVLTFLGVIFVPMMLQGLDALGPITGTERIPQENLALIVSLARWTFPYLFFIGLAVFAMGPLFVKGHYATPSWSPALLNVSLIATCLLMRGWFPDPAYALVVGVWLGGIAQVTVQYIALSKHTGVWRPSFDFSNSGLPVIFTLLVPVLIGQATGEVNKLVDALFAAKLQNATVSALYFANRLVQLPLSVFGFATAAAILPTLSAAASRDDIDGLRDTLMHGLRQTLFLVLPSALGLILLGRPIIRLLFERGNFSAELGERTATALAIYAVGLLSFAGVKVAVTGFYAVKDTKTPVIVASISMLLNIALNCAFVRGLGYKGLALATTISFTVNFVVLYILLCERFGRLWNPVFLNALHRIFWATLMALVVAYVVHRKIAAVFAGDGVGEKAACALVPIAAAVVSYAGLAWLMGIEELRQFAHMLRRRQADE